MDNQEINLNEDAGLKKSSFEEELNFRKKLEEMIVNFSTLLIGARVEELDKLIKNALKDIGEFVDADRVYVFKGSEDRKKVYYLYEWCREGITPQQERLREVQVEDFPWLRERLEKRKEVVSIPSVEQLPPEAGREKQEFMVEGTKSVLLVPMVFNEEVIGFLGFDAVRKEKEWCQECVLLLKIMGKIIANALIRRETDFLVEEGRRFLHSVFESIQDGISILDKDLNIVTVNPTMEKWYAHNSPLVGKKCYFAYHNRSEPCLICPTQKTLKTKKQAYEVVPKCGPGGEVVGWVDLYSFPLFDSLTGEMKGVIEYVRDATERKKAEELLNKLTLNLRKTNRKLRQLSLKDSHTGLYNYRYLREVI
ncbi:MAG: PAS domain-containing protein [Candidatus Omnitrophica bacterium]|nr:PAS domain-containing protein [Candidatus Omnitrophota bacterium]